MNDVTFNLEICGTCAGCAGCVETTVFAYEPKQAHEDIDDVIISELEAWGWGFDGENGKLYCPDCLERVDDE